MSESSEGRRLKEPPSDISKLRAFPMEHAFEGDRVWRVHQTQYDPWFFGASGMHRFDLTTAGWGTCYVAKDHLTAILETIDIENGIVTRDFLASRSIRQLILPQDFRLADTANSLASPFGVTREISSEYPYLRCQRWASAFREAEFGGIAYFPNHNLDSAASSLALFHKAGVKKRWRRVRADSLASSSWISVISREAGISVADRPDSSELDILE